VSNGHPRPMPFNALGGDLSLDREQREALAAALLGMQTSMSGIPPMATRRGQEAMRRHLLPDPAQIAEREQDEIDREALALQLSLTGAYPHVEGGPVGAWGEGWEGEGARTPEEDRPWAQAYDPRPVAHVSRRSKEGRERLAAAAWAEEQRPGWLERVLQRYVGAPVKDAVDALTYPVRTVGRQAEHARRGDLPLPGLLGAVQEGDPAKLGVGALSGLATAGALVDPLGEAAAATGAEAAAEAAKKAGAGSLAQMGLSLVSGVLAATTAYGVAGFASKRGRSAVKGFLGKKASRDFFKGPEFTSEAARALNVKPPPGRFSPQQRQQWLLDTGLDRPENYGNLIRAARNTEALWAGGKRVPTLQGVVAHPSQTPDFLDLAPGDGSRFIEAAHKSKRRGYLTDHTAEDVDRILAEGGVVRLSPDGKTGYLRTAEGDIQNVFNNEGATGAGVLAVTHAISSAPADMIITLDAFDGFLPRLYQQLGFRPYMASEWNDKFKPEHWRIGTAGDPLAQGRPDVVFMRHTGERDAERLFELAGEHPVFDSPRRRFGYDTELSEEQFAASVRGADAGKLRRPVGEGALELSTARVGQSGGVLGELGEQVGRPDIRVGRGWQSEPVPTSPELAGYGEDLVEYAAAAGANIRGLSRLYAVTHGDHVATIPGGLDGKFSYLDSLVVRQQSVDPRRMDEDYLAPMYNKLHRSMEIDPQDDLRVFNRLMFGQLSSNTDYPSNEWIYSALHATGARDIQDFARMHDQVGNLLFPDALRKLDKNGEWVAAPINAANHELSKAFRVYFGFVGASRGGVRMGTQPLLAVTRMAKHFVDYPGWHRPRPGESMPHYVERLMGAELVIQAKTGSYAVANMFPGMGNLIPIDRQVINFENRLEDVLWKGGANGAEAMAFKRKTLAALNTKSLIPFKDWDHLKEAKKVYREVMTQFIKSRTAMPDWYKEAMSKNLVVYPWPGGGKAPSIKQSYYDISDIYAKDASRLSAMTGADVTAYDAMHLKWDQIRGYIETQAGLHPEVDNMPRPSIAQLRLIEAAWSAHKLTGSKTPKDVLPAAGPGILSTLF
jgi:hypothetical protein